MRVVGGVQGRTHYYEFQQWGAGTVMVPGDNPEGMEIPNEMLQGIVIDPRTPILDADNHTAIAKLFIWALENAPGNGNGYTAQADSNNECGVLLAISEDYDHCIVGVSRQVIGGARVTMDRSNGAINILTGEVYPHWPPDGYVENGDIHSHNRMQAYFSGQDDRDDAGIPGRHLVYGNFRKDKGGIYQFDIASSIVVRFTRYQKVNSQQGETRTMVATDLVDLTWTKAKVHKDVYSRISLEEPEGFAKRDTGPRIGMQKNYPVTHPLAPYLSDDEYEKKYERDWKKWHDKKKAEFPTDFDWLHDILHPAPVKEHPNQTKFWQMGDEEDEPEKEETWAIKYMRMEIEAVLDGLDRILQLAPDKKTGAEIIKQVVQSTGLFKKKGAKKK